MGEFGLVPNLSILAKAIVTALQCLKLCAVVAASSVLMKPIHNKSMDYRTHHDYTCIDQKSAIIWKSAQQEGLVYMCFEEYDHSWLFSMCEVVMHHGGSGTVAAAYMQAYHKFYSAYVRSV
eukprot:TRINITY_DN4578_c0_g1_i1.p1 TRINITY_DN4578_c0_g1~~TRINITY_DN4578_c0_g1_i1.p1  ORF type:complete len:121 (+),score=10.26 TRINITY_DN4578_c0_g1_i1:85-447(+)